MKMVVNTKFMLISKDKGVSELVIFLVLDVTN